MKLFKVTGVALLALVLAPSALGSVIYDTLNGTDGDVRGSSRFEPWLDDVSIQNGGILSEIKFSLVFDPSSTEVVDQVTDATVFLFADVDDEDEDPDPNDPDFFSLNGADPLVFKQTLTDLTVPADGTLTTFSVSGIASQSILIPDNANMWIGLQVANSFHIAMPLTGPVSVGSTNPDIYNFQGFSGSYSGLTPSPSPNTAGLAFQISVVPEPATMSLMVLGSAALLLRRRRCH